MLLQFSSIWAIDRTLSGATTSGQSESGSYGNEGALRIPQSSSITWAFPLDCLVSYLGCSLMRVLPLYRNTASVFCCPSWLGHSLFNETILNVCVRLYFVYESKIFAEYYQWFIWSLLFQVNYLKRKLKWFFKFCFKFSAVRFLIYKLVQKSNILRIDWMGIGRKCWEG